MTDTRVCEFIDKFTDPQIARARDGVLSRFHDHIRRRPKPPTLTSVAKVLGGAIGGAIGDDPQAPVMTAFRKLVSSGLAVLELHHLFIDMRRMSRRIRAKELQFTIFRDIRRDLERALLAGDVREARRMLEDIIMKHVRTLDPNLAKTIARIARDIFTAEFVGVKRSVRQTYPSLAGLLDIAVREELRTLTFNPTPGGIVLESRLVPPVLRLLANVFGMLSQEYSIEHMQTTIDTNAKEYNIPIFVPSDDNLESLAKGFTRFFEENSGDSESIEITKIKEGEFKHSNPFVGQLYKNACKMPNVTEICTTKGARTVVLFSNTYNSDLSEMTYLLSRLTHDSSFVYWVRRLATDLVVTAFPSDKFLDIAIKYTNPTLDDFLHELPAFTITFAKTETDNSDPIRQSMMKYGILNCQHPIDSSTGWAMHIEVATMTLADHITYCPSSKSRDDEVIEEPQAPSATPEAVEEELLVPGDLAAVDDVSLSPGELFDRFARFATDPPSEYIQEILGKTARVVTVLNQLGIAHGNLRVTDILIDYHENVTIRFSEHLSLIGNRLLAGAATSDLGHLQANMQQYAAPSIIDLFTNACDWSAHGNTNWAAFIMKHEWARIAILYIAPSVYHTRHADMFGAIGLPYAALLTRAGTQYYTWDHSAKYLQRMIVKFAIPHMSIADQLLTFIQYCRQFMDYLTYHAKQHVIATEITTQLALALIAHILRAYGEHEGIPRVTLELINPRQLARVIYQATNAVRQQYIADIMQYLKSIVGTIRQSIAPRHASLPAIDSSLESDGPSLMLEQQDYERKFSDKSDRGRGSGRGRRISRRSLETRSPFPESDSLRSSDG